MGIVALERLDILFSWQLLNFISMVIVFAVTYFFFREDIFVFLWIWTLKEAALYAIYMVVLYHAHITHE